MLDAQGELVDMLHCANISKKSTKPNALALKGPDMKALQTFIVDHSPHVIAVGASNLACADMKESIFECIRRVFEDNARAVPVETGDISVVRGTLRSELPRALPVFPLPLSLAAALTCFFILSGVPRRNGGAPV